jgi:hypothetical protein
MQRRKREFLRNNIPGQIRNTAMNTISLTKIQMALKLPDGRIFMTTQMRSGFHPERQNKVDDNRRTEGKKRSVDKIQPHATC